MTLGGLITKYRSEHDMSQRKFADLCCKVALAKGWARGVTNGYISMLEKGVNPKTGKKITPSFQTYVLCSEVMGIKFSELCELIDDESLISSMTLADNIDQYTVASNVAHPTKVLTHQVRLISRIAAGEPIPTEDEWETVDAPAKADYALTIKGDSMSPDYMEDDIVYIRATDSVEDGSVAAVLLDDSATLKRVYHIPNGIQLVSLNPRYAPMVYIGQKDADTIRILGVPVGFTRMFK